MLKKFISIQKLRLIITCLALTTSGMANSQADKAPLPLDDGWQVATPSESGFSPEGLSALTQAIKNGDIANIHAIVVEHNNALVYEEYFSGPDEKLGTSLGEITFDHNTFHDLRSVTKSVTTALLGIALDGDYEQVLAKPVHTFFPEIKNQLGTGAEKVTLQHALTMTAGLDWNEMTVPYSNPKNDEVAMYSEANPEAMVLGRNSVTPVGTTWYYNGGLAQVVAGVITELTDMPLDKYAQKVLFQPLGIENYDWMGPKHWQSPSAAAGLRLNIRDMAKIGSVYLHNGKWKGQQIVPETWVKKSTQKYVDSVPWGDQYADYGYGFMWYPGTAKDPSNLKVIRAVGWGGQRIILFPDLKLNISIFAGNYQGGAWDNDAKIIKAILAARS